MSNNFVYTTYDIRYTVFHVIYDEKTIAHKENILFCTGYNILWFDFLFFLKAQ